MARKVQIQECSKQNRADKNYVSDTPRTVPGKFKQYGEGHDGAGHGDYQ